MEGWFSAGFLLRVREWGVLPVRCDDGVAFDVDVFGFGLLADTGEGGFVFLLL